MLRFSHSRCSGSPTGAVAGQPAALPAAVIGILEPDSGKPSVQVQQVKRGMRVLTQQHSATCDSDKENWQDLLSWAGSANHYLENRRFICLYFSFRSSSLLQRIHPVNKSKMHFCRRLSDCPSTRSIFPPPRKFLQRKKFELSATIQGPRPPQQQKKTKLYKTCIVLLLSSFASSDLNNNELV